MNIKNYITTLSAFTLLLLFTLSAFGQQSRGTIRGKIITNNNEPAENVSVGLKSTTYGVITNEDGTYEFRAPAGNYTLVVSHISIKTQELAITVTGGKATQVPVITVSAGTNLLREVNVKGEQTNKFARKHSNDVAKMPLNNLENPQSYSTVGKEVLQEQAIFSVDDAIKNVPGITTLWTPTGRAGDGGSYFTLRGFTVQTSLRNGVAGMITNTIDAANLEKLEVIKGPSGALYGSSLISFGGLLNRVTKKPFETTAGEITYSGGSYNLNRVSADYNTPLDSAKKALLRINTAYSNSNSFQDNGFNKNFVFDPSFTYKASDKLTLTFDAEISHGTGTTPPIFYFPYGMKLSELGVYSADKLNLDYNKRYQSNDLVTTSDNANFYAQADYKISDSWKSQTNIGTTNSSSSGYGPYFYLQPGNETIARNVWEITGNAATLQVQQNFIGDFKIGKLRNRLVAGIDVLRQTSNLVYTDPNNGSDSFDVVNTKGAIPNYNNFNKAKVDSLFTNLPASTFNSVYTNYTYSVYASDVLNITDNLMAMVSLRLDNFTTKPLTDATSGETTKGYHQFALSPKFGLVYQLLKDQVSLFGNYMNGFSNNSPGIDHNNKAFKPEQANQLEGGVKLDLFNGKLSSTISYYDIKVKDIIKTDPVNPGFSIQNGTQYSRGFEAEVIANPVNGLNIIGGYSHNKSLMTNSDDYDNGRRPETAGPANSVNFWASYSLTGGSAKGLGIGFGGNYAGDSHVINNSVSDGVFTLPAYTVLNSGIFFNKEKYRFSLNVNNLTNKHYWIGYTTVDPQMLRQVIGSISFKF